MTNTVSRRKFLKMGGASMGLLACGGENTARLDGGGPWDGGAPLDGAAPDGAAPDGAIPVFNPGAPVLGNFRVESGQALRVYFDSSKPITASTIAGFEVSGKTLSAVTVNVGAMEGHYFTVTGEFNLFQKGRMIRYLGGADMEDAESVGPHTFTWQHIRNDMVQAAPLRERYVTVSGSGQHDGTLGNEWDFGEAVANAMAGDLIHVGPGDHGAGTYTLSASGTEANPIVFQGYKLAPNDIVSQYWNYGDGAFDPAAMPYFNSGNRVTGAWMTCTGRSNVILRNFQVEEYQYMVFSSSGDSQICEGLLCNKLGDPEGYSGVGLHSHGDDVSYVDCTVMNATAVNFRNMTSSRYNLLSGCKSYCDESLETGSKASTDYYFANHGSYNVTKNCRIERFGDLQHHGHGFTFKDLNGEVHNCLLEDSVVVNIKQAIDLNRIAYDNVIRRVTVLGDPNDTGALDGGIKLDANCRNNTFEYCNLSGFRDAAVAYDMASGDHSGNKLIGCIIKDVGTLVGGASFATSLQFINCIVENVTNLGASLDNSNSFTNTLFIGVANGAANAVYSNSGFHNSFTTPSGSGNVSDDPQLDASYRPTAATPASITEGGQFVAGAAYDADGYERTEPVSIGAFEALGAS